MMTEFELIEAWYLAAQMGANTFVSSSTVIFAYIVVAHISGKSLDRKIAVGLTLLYSLFLAGSIGARFAPFYTQLNIGAEYIERFPEGNGLGGGAISPIEMFIFGILPFVLAWAASVYYLHFHVRERETIIASTTHNKQIKEMRYAHSLLKAPWLYRKLGNPQDKLKKESINELVSQYESGKLTRRGLLGAIAFLTAPNHLQAQTSLFRARSLNHVNIRVEDLSRAEAFYTGVLGLPPVREVVGAGYALDFPGGGFISLCPLSSSTCGVKQNPQKGDIDHFAIGIDNFDADRVEAELKNAGYAQVRNASTSVFVADPDGTMLQLSAIGYDYDL